jgi:nucleotide-binding universal stress UspA family protein
LDKAHRVDIRCRKSLFFVPPQFLSDFSHLPSVLMLDDLLLAFDFSPSSKRALAYSIDLSQRTDATLHLMYVQEVPQGPFEQEARSPMPTYKLQEKFKERCQEFLSPHDLDVDDDRLSFNADRADAVAPALVRYAESKNVDMITMGTYGRRGVERAFYGSVAEETLRTAPAPVFTVRVPDEDESATSVERVVAPVDFSDPSRRALQQAHRFATLYEVPLKLVHVVESPSTPSVYELESPMVTSHKTKEKAEAALEEWGSDLATEPQKVSYVVHRGDPAPSILRSAPNETDLIVMATRGLRGVQRAMLGSVTEEVLRGARGPVLAARNFPSTD